MEELNNKIFPGLRKIQDTNPESEEPQKKRKCSVGQAHLKLQTCFGRRTSLLSFICLLAFAGKSLHSNLGLPFKKRLYLTLFVYLPSKTCNISIGIDLFTWFHTHVVIWVCLLAFKDIQCLYWNYLSLFLYLLSKQCVFISTCFRKCALVFP